MDEYTFDAVELPSRYAKAIVAILTAVVTVLVAALTDNRVSTVEVVQVAIALVAAVGVYLVPNLADGVGRYTKMIVAVVGAALQASAAILAQGDLGPQGVLTILVAALGAVSVGIIPNAGGYTPERAIEAA